MSYRKIFSVINEHTASTVTARYAISLAVSCKAELVLYSAHKGNDASTLLRTTGHLDHLQAIASELKLPVSRITEEGDINQLLPQRVLAEGADLVWYPLSLHEQFGSYLRRHKVHRLLRAIGSDLAVMRVIAMVKPHPVHMLVPLGKVGNVKEPRLLFVAELARSFKSQVTLFHLSDGGEKEMPGGITRFREYLQQQQIIVLERRGKGNVAEAIGVEAVTRRNDLIVLGASERGVLRRTFFGAPTCDVMNQPPCNTILFRSSHLKAL